MVGLANLPKKEFAWLSPTKKDRLARLAAD
jgi:hypothetical protein